MIKCSLRLDESEDWDECPYVAGAALCAELRQHKRCLVAHEGNDLTCQASVTAAMLRQDAEHLLQ